MPESVEKVNVPKIWRAGTLKYSNLQLCKLFGWLLIGNFATTLVIIGFPIILPLYFRTLKFSTTQIAWLMGLAYLAALLVPIIGFWSDRTRTRWGRRRPFDLVTAPIWFLGLIMIPFATSFFAMNVAMLLVSFAGSAMVCITLLYNDVIPGEVMGRFIAMLRLVGFIGGLVIQYLVLPIFDKHATLVFVSCATIAVVFEILMLLNVKEGQYSDPDPQSSILNYVATYIKECFNSNFLWYLYLTGAVAAIGAPAANFFILFFSTEIGMSTSSIGMMMGTGTLVAMILAIPSGLLVDKIGPKIVWGVSVPVVGIIQICMYFLITDIKSAWILYIIYYGFNMILSAALLPLMFYHLPKSKFGQFFTANFLLSSCLGCLGSNAVGWCISLAGGSYRNAFIFGGVFYCLSPLFLLLLRYTKNPFENLETSISPKKQPPAFVVSDAKPVNVMDKIKNGIRKTDMCGKIDENGGIAR